VSGGCGGHCVCSLGVF